MSRTTPMINTVTNSDQCTAQFGKSDFFYGAQNFHFPFYRLPKALFQNARFKGISVKAKVLYCILLDRMMLSLKNSWRDDLGRYYIIFTVSEIMGLMGCGNKKAVALLTELETKAKLIERRHQGVGKPTLIYVRPILPEMDTSGTVKKTFAECPKYVSGGVQKTL